jgi:hypothetical protein
MFGFALTLLEFERRACRQVFRPRLRPYPQGVIAKPNAETSPDLHDLWPFAFGKERSRRCQRAAIVG